MTKLSETDIRRKREKSKIINCLKCIKKSEYFGKVCALIHVSIADMDFFCYNIAHRADQKGLLIQKEEKTEWLRKEILLLDSRADLPL